LLSLGLMRPKISQIRAAHPFVAAPKKTKTKPTASVAEGLKYMRGSKEIDLSAFETKKLLSDGDTNAKTAKNTRKTKILYLVPASKSGVNVCEKASAGCIASCLFSAGRGAFANVIEARKQRTYLMLGFERYFLQKLAAEITAAAKRTKGQLAVRLNGTSDLPFIDRLNDEGWLQHIPSNVVFYDYTKFPSRAGVYMYGKHKYVVTFSRSETNTKEALQELHKGGIVAVVFRGTTLPKYWYGYRVVDGDERDDLMLDLKPSQGNGVVIGLRAKGKAKGEVRGFVIDCDSLVDCRVGL